MGLIAGFYERQNLQNSSGKTICIINGCSLSNDSRKPASIFFFPFRLKSNCCTGFLRR